jgi:alkyl hydroperoxide reductase subunit D
MSTLDAVRDSLPDVAKDIRLNLDSVLRTTSLSVAQRWGVALASALAVRQPRLTAAILESTTAATDQSVVDDAAAAAVLMGMNNVFYRFRHMIDKETYSTRPARLRMNRLVRPATNRADFELFSLAVSAINGCESCVRAHEKAVLDGGLTEEHVHDAIRIAATIHAAAVALDALPCVAPAAGTPAPQSQPGIAP